MNIRRRLLKLEQIRRGNGGGMDDLAALKLRCELLLQVAGTDEEQDRLLRCIWEIENGYYARWRAAEDAARPKRWAVMCHDERAAETAERLRSGRDFLYTQPECPELPEGALEELRRRYGK
jgi:hypothetical protein